MPDLVRVCSYKQFVSKNRSLRRCWAAIITTCHSCPSFRQFPPTSYFAHRADVKAPVFKKGTILTLHHHFCTKQKPLCGPWAQTLWQTQQVLNSQYLDSNLTAKTVYRKFETNTVFPNMKRPAYSAAGKQVDLSLEYINRSQIHECGNWD